MNRNLLLNFGRILLSALFIFSAISKFISLPFFDGMVAEFLIGPDYFDHPKEMFWSQVFTRVLITGELVLGIAVLQNKWFKRLVMPSIMLILILFTVHLFIDSLSKPNGFIEGNCGCFGDVLPMNNLESILKNVAAIFIGIFVWIKYNERAVFNSWVSPFLVGAISLFTLSFGIKSFEAPEINEEVVLETPVDTAQAPIDTLSPDLEEELILGSEAPREDELNIPETEPEAQEVETVVAAEPSTTSLPKTTQLLYQYVPALKSVDLSKGQKVVCLFSMTCSHCQEVYADICKVTESPNLPQLYLVNFGSQYEQSYFFSQAGECEHPHNLIEDYVTFKRLLEGETYPRILVYKDGQIVKSWNVDTYTKDGFLSYFNITEKEKEEGGLDLIKKDSPW